MQRAHGKKCLKVVLSACKPDLHTYSLIIILEAELDVERKQLPLQSL